ncbi:MAG: hypothetical protein ACE5ID_08070 [Acidobacteriota bacterium]
MGDSVGALLRHGLLAGRMGSSWGVVFSPQNLRGRMERSADVAGPPPVLEP